MWHKWSLRIFAIGIQLEILFLFVLDSEVCAYFLLLILGAGWEHDWLRWSIQFYVILVFFVMAGYDTFFWPQPLVTKNLN